MDLLLIEKLRKLVTRSVFLLHALLIDCGGTNHTAGRSVAGDRKSNSCEEEE